MVVDDIVFTSEPSVLIDSSEDSDEKYITSLLILKGLLKYVLVASKNPLDKYTSENVGTFYKLIIGPIDNQKANKLVSTFISKGYKENELILE